MFAGLFLLLSCQTPDNVVDDRTAWASWAVTDVGPYGAGYRTWTHSYEPALQLGPEFVTDFAGTRDIQLNVWYPTEDSGGPPAAYLSGLYLDDAAILDAVAASPAHIAGYPLMVYSHGDMGFGGDSAAISRFFASHGWVVLAPDHTQNTLIDTVLPRPTDHYVHRPLDIGAAVDAIAALADVDPLSEVDTRSYMVTGHSFGCYAVWASAGANYDEAALGEHCPSLEEGDCTASQKAALVSGALADPRVVSAVTMGGSIRRGFFGQDGHRGVSSPLLLMSGTEDNHGIPESWGGLQDMAEVAWLELVGGCHQSFATGICSSLEPSVGFGLIGAYSLAWGRRDVLKDETVDVRSLLDGERSISDKAIYSTPPPTR